MVYQRSLEAFSVVWAFIVCISLCAGSHPSESDQEFPLPAMDPAVMQGRSHEITIMESMPLSIGSNSAEKIIREWCQRDNIITVFLDHSHVLFLYCSAPCPANLPIILNLPPGPWDELVQTWAHSWPTEVWSDLSGIFCHPCKRDKRCWHKMFTTRHRNLWDHRPLLPLRIENKVSKYFAQSWRREVWSPSRPADSGKICLLSSALRASLAHLLCSVTCTSLLSFHPARGLQFLEQ